jgi:hypothetical protein
MCHMPVDGLPALQPTATPITRRWVRRIRAERHTVRRLIQLLGGGGGCMSAAAEGACRAVAMTLPSIVAQTRVSARSAPR